MSAVTPYYVITSHLTPKPSELATAHRYRRVEDAFHDMGAGVQWPMPARRAVAFHESHLPMVERLHALGRVKL